MVRRLPCQDGVSPAGTTHVEYQGAAALGPAGGGTVTAAIDCPTAALPPYGTVFRSPPDLMADGSIGMARLV